MSDALLQVEMIEVVYKRVITAVQGVTLFPYLIERGLHALPGMERYASDLAAVNQAAFGVVMILFLLFEPLGLVGIWRRVQNYFLLWPFRYRPLGGGGK